MKAYENEMKEHDPAYQTATEKKKTKKEAKEKVKKEAKQDKKERNKQDAQAREMAIPPPTPAQAAHVAAFKKEQTAWRKGLKATKMARFAKQKEEAPARKQRVNEKLAALLAMKPLSPPPQPPRIVCASQANEKLAALLAMKPLSPQPPRILCASPPSNQPQKSWGFSGNFGARSTPCAPSPVDALSVNKEDQIQATLHALLQRKPPPPPMLVQEESFVVQRPRRAGDSTRDTFVSSYLASLSAIKEAEATEEGKQMRESKLKEHLDMYKQMRFPKTWCDLSWLGQLCEHGKQRYVD